MAEILGTVASGLAVAEVGLKVGGTVWKLKRLWQEVHEVPTTIQDLMSQIEIMDPILSDHETTIGNQNTVLPTQTPTHSGTAATQSAAYCREALNDLQGLVEDLDVAIKSGKRSRRTVARIRVVLKRDIIKGFEDRLERAIRLLQWTQVNYLAANATITGAIMTEMWTAVADIQTQQQLMLQQLGNSSLTGIPPFPVVTEHVGTSPERTLDKRGRVHSQGNRISLPWSRPSIFGTIMFRNSETRASGEETYAIRFQLPKWLSQRVWDISISRVCSGWQGGISTWNIVPQDSPGIRCVRKGDLDGLLDLYGRGVASPRDCDAGGFTTFEVACLFSHNHIVNHLIDMNVDTAQIRFKGIESLVALHMSRLPMETIRRLSSRGFFDPLSNAAEELLSSSYPMSPSWSFSYSMFCLAYTMHTPELFTFCFTTCVPFWRAIPPGLKQKTVQLMSSYPHPWPVDCARLLICPDSPIRPIDVQEWKEGGVSLLQLLFFIYLKSPPGAGFEDWNVLLEETIKATDDVHHLVESPYPLSDISDTCSAFESALVESLYDTLHGEPINWDGEGTPRPGLKELRMNLKSLLSVLTCCDHDLLEFGQKEASMWVGKDDTVRVVGNALYLKVDDRHDGAGDVWTVHYGAKLSDWYLELDYSFEHYVGDFWNRIENPHLFMVPGAWVDEQ